MTSSPIKPNNENSVTPVINHLTTQWLNGMQVPAVVNNQKSKLHNIKTQGSYSIVTERDYYRISGTHKYDCSSESQCIKAISEYEQSVTIGKIKPALYKSIELIKSDPVGSFALYKQVDSCAHAYIETCDTCNGRGENRCHGCHGSGETSCYNCSSGRVSCNNCNGGYVSNNNGSSERCYTCSGSGQRDCNTCCGNARVTCSTCSGRGKLHCSPCDATGYFTTTITVYARLKGQQSCKWSSDPAYPWLDLYIEQALEKKLNHAPLNETVTWDLTSFEFAIDTAFPLKTEMDGEIKTTAADVDIDKTGAVNCQFIGEIYKPFNMSTCFDGYLLKHCEKLNSNFSQQHCKTLFATNIAKDTFEFVKSEELPSNIAYKTNMVSPQLAKTLKETLLNTGHVFDKIRKKVTIPRVLLSMLMHLVWLFAVITVIDVIFTFRIDWQSVNSSQLLSSLLVNVQQGFILLFEHKPQALVMIFVISFIPMLILRSWLGSNQIWHPVKLFIGYIIITPIFFTIFSTINDQNLAPIIDDILLTKEAFMHSTLRCLALLFDLMMLAGLIAILRVRKSAYSKNRKVAKKIDSSALNRLLNYE